MASVEQALATIGDVIMERQTRSQWRVNRPSREVSATFPGTGTRWVLVLGDGEMPAEDLENLIEELIVVNQRAHASKSVTMV